MTGIQARSLISVLSPYALTTVYNVRTALGIPKDKLSDDLVYRLERLINAATTSIETYCDRNFVQREHIEIYDGRGTDRFVPRHWPITDIVELWLDSNSKFIDTNNLLDADEYVIADDATTIELVDRLFPSARYSVKIRYKSGFVGVPADLIQAADMYVEWFYRFNERGDIGRSTRSKGDESINIEQGIPTIVIELIKKYKRFEFGGATPRSSINV